ncbi:MAG: TM2 domain-containing protein [Muribaculaceae bacterium]|nr:TM2 domain-containing protein [Muribaculaceae bacterium]
MENNLETQKGKNWVAAMALCWLFGSFGAHRFYTGKSNSAWIMLVFSATGLLAPISATWALIDGIVLALGQFQHEDGSNLYERIPGFGYFYIASVIYFTIVGIICAIGFISLIAASVQDPALLNIH